MTGNDALWNPRGAGGKHDIDRIRIDGSFFYGRKRRLVDRIAAKLRTVYDPERSGGGALELLCSARRRAVADDELRSERFEN